MNVDFSTNINVSGLKQEFVKHYNCYPNSAALFTNKDFFVATMSRLDEKKMGAVARFFESIKDEFARGKMNKADLRSVASDFEFLSKKIMKAVFNRSL